MIIECQACRARYKLDESRIKGKGARVRCRKCGESIIVMKGEIPPPRPAPPPGKELFDLRAILKEPERRIPRPPPERIDAPPPVPDVPQPPVEKERETFAPEPPVRTPDPVSPPPAEEERAAFAQEPEEQVPEAPPPPRDEVDDAFERIHDEAREKDAAWPPPEERDAGIDQALSGPGEAEEAPPPAEEERAAFAQEPEEQVPEAPPPPRDEVDHAYDGVLRPEEPVPLPEFRDAPLMLEEEAAQGGGAAAEGEEELVVPAPPPRKESGPEREAAEFLVLDPGETEDLRMERKAPAAGDRFDISEKLSETPLGTLVEEEDAADRASEPPHPPGKSPFSRTEALQDQLSDLNARTGYAPIESQTPADIPPPKPLEIERAPAPRPRAKTPSGRPSIALLVALFAVLAGGGAYLAFTSGGQETLRTLVSGLESYWLGGRKSAPSYNVGNLIGYYESGEKTGRLFIIKGTVTNQGRGTKSGVRIRAELLDASRRTIAERTVYAGNVIHGLRSADRESIDAAMSNRFGDKLSNVDVAPGKSVPFMVVIFDPPEGIEEYRLEAMDGE